MVVARTLEAQTDLVRQLQARTVKRRYLALVWGNMPEEGTIDAPIGRVAVIDVLVPRTAHLYFPETHIPGHAGRYGNHSAYRALY